MHARIITRELDTIISAGGVDHNHLIDLSFVAHE